MHIGLFFGSFNPIHIGHLIIANAMINLTKLDKVWFVVSPQSPFKKKSNLLNEYDRLHLVQVAVEDNDKLKASDFEFSLPKPSFTIDTLVSLKEKYPNDTFSLIMGSDNVINLHKWKNADILTRDYHIYVYERPGSTIESLPKNITLVQAPLMHVSATYIRNSIKKGQSVRYLVPEKVYEEIEKSGFYK